MTVSNVQYAHQTTQAQNNATPKYPTPANPTPKPHDSVHLSPEARAASGGSDQNGDY